MAPILFPHHQEQQQQQQQQQREMFISSSVYHGFVPLISNNNGHIIAMDMDHDVTMEDCNNRQKKYNFEKTEEIEGRCVKKRCFVPDNDFNFKRFKKDAGKQSWFSSPTTAAVSTSSESRNYGFTKVYHESSLLHLNSTSDQDLKRRRRVNYHQTTTNVASQSKNNYINSNSELEEMLLLTHGVTSYHYFNRQSEDC